MTVGVREDENLYVVYRRVAKVGRLLRKVC